MVWESVVPFISANAESAPICAAKSAATTRHPAPGVRRPLRQTSATMSPARHAMTEPTPCATPMGRPRASADASEMPVPSAVSRMPPRAWAADSPYPTRMGAASDIVEDASAPPTAHVRRTRGRGTESRPPFSSSCEPKGMIPPPDCMGPAVGASPAPSGVGGTPLLGHALIVRALFSRASGASRGYGHRGWRPRGRCRGEAPSRGRA